MGAGVQQFEKGRRWGGYWMKIVIISDTHLLIQEEVPIPVGDILVHCGDCLNSGNFTELPRFLKWFSQLNFRYKILVPGNHDFCFDDEYRDYSKIEFLKMNSGMRSAFLLIDNAVEIEGVKFYGSPWQGSLPNWACYRDKKFRKLAWSAIPEGLDFLITHVPPFGILDKAYHWTGSGYLKTQKEHSGSKLLKKHVLRTKPKYHVFGHIHESAGLYKTPETLFINAANLNRDYNYQNPPIVIDLQEVKNEN